jgi:hypothetical protein
VVRFPSSRRFYGSSRNYGRSRHPRQHEAFDCHAFKSNRQEECVQMPVKIARSAPRPSFGLPELLVAIHTSRQSCCKAGKARTFSSGVTRGILVKGRPHMGATREGTDLWRGGIVPMRSTPISETSSPSKRRSRPSRRRPTSGSWVEPFRKIMSVFQADAGPGQFQRRPAGRKAIPQRIAQRCGNAAP